VVINPHVENLLSLSFLIPIFSELTVCADVTKQTISLFIVV